jgi:hypothetical protein
VVCDHGLISDGAGGCTCGSPASGGGDCISATGDCESGILTTEGCFVCTTTLPSCGVGQPSCVTSTDCASDEICAPNGQSDVCGVPGAKGVCVPLCAA